MQKKGQITSQQFFFFLAQHPSLSKATSLSFCKTSEAPLAEFIPALLNECSWKFGISPQDVTMSSTLTTYEKAAEAGDCLACLRLASLYSEKNNKFQLPLNKEKSWAYVILAMLHSFFSPLGIDAKLQTLFTNFLVSDGDSLLILNKILEFVKTSSEPIIEKYKDIIIEIFPALLDKRMAPSIKAYKFRTALDNFPHVIMNHHLGGFILGSFTGDYETDSNSFSKASIYDYFNDTLKHLFSLYNSNFTIDDPAHGFLLLGNAINVINYILWKGQEYKGEADDCTIEIVRMCKTVYDNYDSFGFNKEIMGSFAYILSWIYQKGILVTKNLGKALLLIADCDPCDILPNVMFEKARLKEKIGLEEESMNLYKKNYKFYSDLTTNNNHCLPVDYFIMGVLETKINNDINKAKMYWERGMCVKIFPVIKPIECLLYQKKCMEKLKKYHCIHNI